MPAQSKKSQLAIRANVNTSNHVVLVNANSATHQKSKTFCKKNCREIS